jgi:hypothetical protein
MQFFPAFPMFQLNRVFCATSWELEGERRAFYDVVGEVNETHGSRAGAMYVPVSLVNVRDKRPLQYTVEENIRDSVGYLLALSGDWGPIERNFERDLRLALDCRRDPALPMRNVALLLRRSPASPPSFLADLAATGVSPISFDDIPGFRSEAQRLLTEWLG